MRERTVLLTRGPERAHFAESSVKSLRAAVASGWEITGMLAQDRDGQFVVVRHDGCRPESMTDALAAIGHEERRA
jgi:hypothetical protein